VTITYAPPPLAPIQPFDFTSGGTETATVIYNSPPAAPDSAVFAPVQAVLPTSATTTPTYTAIEASAPPRIKPASFTTQGPVSLAPIQTVPIQTEIGLPVQEPVTDTSAISAQPQFGSNTGSTFVTVDGPIPSGKPEGVGAEAPRLSDDDFRITTLALGEEDSGGG